MSIQQYQTIEQARLNDATLYRMSQLNCSSEQIILQLVNEKASLLQELQDLHTRLSPPIIVIHPDGSMTSKPQIHIPKISPNTIQ